MATQAQTAANRRNAQKSTGPRTAEGKAESRLNALGWGLCATSVPVLPGESQEQFAELGEALYDHYQPQPGLEEELVERLNELLWRLRRVYPLETGILAQYIKQGHEADLEKARLTRMMSPTTGRAKAGKSVESEPVELEDEELELLADLADARGDAVFELGRAFIADSEGANALTKLARYDTTLVRQVDRIKRQLHDLQAARLADPD